MKKLYLLAVTVLTMTSHTSFAATKIPTDLIYNGKPIDTLCFSDVANDNQINLKDCGLQKMNYSINSTNADLIKKGYTGFDWKDNSNAEFKAQGYSYYKSFDAGQQQYWIYSINNGGGSGEFTAIQLVKRTNESTLTSEPVSSGDRCNGGIQDVSAKKDQLTYSVSLTAFDLFALANNNPHKLQAYDDLASCAICCAGKAFYDVNRNKKPVFKYVELEKISKPDEMSQQGKYQACFNKLFADYVAKGNTKLDDAKLNRFIKEFNETCVK